MENEIQKSFQDLKEKLIAQSKRKGVGENFGKKKIRNLSDSLSTCENWSEVMREATILENWAENYKN